MKQKVFILICLLAVNLIAGGVPDCYAPCYIVANAAAAVACAGGCTDTVYDAAYDLNFNACMVGGCIGADGSYPGTPSKGQEALMTPMRPRIVTAAAIAKVQAMHLPRPEYPAFVKVTTSKAARYIGDSLSVRGVAMMAGGGQIPGCFTVCPDGRWINACYTGACDPPQIGQPGTLNCPGDCGCPGSENMPKCQGGSALASKVPASMRIGYAALNGPVKPLRLDCPGDCACPGNDQNPACQPQPQPPDPCIANPDLPCMIVGSRGN